MTLSLLSFWLAAAVALASACAVLFAPDAKRAAAASVGVALGASAMASSVSAPAAAVVCGVCGVGASIVLMWSGARGSHGRNWRGVVRRLGIGWRVGLGLAAAAWLWMLAGTMARQYVSFGVDLAARPTFGDASALGESLAGRFGPLVVGVCLLAAVGVYALVAHLDEHDGDDARRMGPGSAREGGSR